jgi:hypothetical protein
MDDLLALRSMKALLPGIQAVKAWIEKRQQISREVMQSILRARRSR